MTAKIPKYCELALQVDVSLQQRAERADKGPQYSIMPEIPTGVRLWSGSKSDMYNNGTGRVFCAQQKRLE